MPRLSISVTSQMLFGLLRVECSKVDCFGAMISSFCFFMQEFQYNNFNQSRSHKQVVVFLLQKERASLGQPDDEKHVCAWGETDISRKLANPHRALWTTRQSNICTTTLIF